MAKGFAIAGGGWKDNARDDEDTRLLRNTGSCARRRDLVDRMKTGNTPGTVRA
jgi:hypothetical protein